MSCLTPERAVDFVAGALPEAPAQEVESHMARCSECRRLVVEIAKAGPGGDTDVDTQPRQPAIKLVSTEPTFPGDSSTTLELHRGSRVGRYTLLYPLGEGGMGSVHAAFDPKLDRRVALKFLRTDLGGAPRPAHRDRLIREARALARLSHPNVVSIFDVAEHRGSVYLAMELVDGNNARVWRELMPRSVDKVVQVYSGALRALIAAHAQGIVHRDFKPDNVLVGADGLARVTDFGLARAAILGDLEAPIPTERLIDWAKLTQTGLVLGTPRYMAPEQFEGNANERSDQFAFCVSMYEALYGHYPLGTKTPDKLDPERPLVDQMLTPLGRDGVPERLRRALLRGMSPDPNDRWPTLHELEFEIRESTTPRPSPARWLAAAAVLTGAITLTLFFGPEKPATRVIANVDHTDEVERAQAETAKAREAQARAENAQRAAETALADLQRELALQATADVEEELRNAARRRRPIAPPPLPVRSVERSITTRLSEVLACYEQSVTGDDELEVRARVGIDRNGRVKWAVGPYKGNDRANMCLEKALMRLNFPAASAATTASLLLVFFRLESGLLAVNMRASTRSASLGQVTVDAKGRVLVDCPPSDALCGL
jgi:hypothetical protein